jgi:hypothetical protein
MRPYREFWGAIFLAEMLRQPFKKFQQIKQDSAVRPGSAIPYFRQFNSGATSSGARGSASSTSGSTSLNVSA